MKKCCKPIYCTLIIIMMILSISCNNNESNSKSINHVSVSNLKFSGGPSGGMFQFFSNGISVYLSRTFKYLDIKNQPSNGSIENIHKIENQMADFGIAYSADVFLASKGQLEGDPYEYNNIRAMAFLYKSPAQLIVLKKSGIKKLSDLVGKKIDIGGTNSGAASSGERYLKLVGLWDDKTIRSQLGYNKAVDSIRNGQIDGIWILAGIPTSAIINLSSTHEISLFDIYTEGMKYGLNKKHPYYKPYTIPANIYKGIKKETKTFSDATLWIVGAHVSEKTVYDALNEIFSEKGLSFLSSIKEFTTMQMSLENGLNDVNIPLHKGAKKFWEEKGITLE